MASWIWLLGGGDAQFGGAKVGTLAQGLGLQVFHVAFERLVGQVANHVEVGGHCVVSQEAAQAGEGLHLRQAGGRDVGLKLQELQLDLQVVAFSNVSGFELRLADVDGLLKTLQVLQREFERGFRQQHADELLADVEGQRAFRVGDLGASDGGLHRGRPADGCCRLRPRSNRYPMPISNC